MAGFVREYLSFLFEIEDGRLMSEFNTSGTHMGGKDSMWMKCVDMELSKVGE